MTKDEAIKGASQLFKMLATANGDVDWLAAIKIAENEKDTESFIAGLAQLTQTCSEMMIKFYENFFEIIWNIENKSLSLQVQR